MDREDLQSVLDRWDAARAELAAFPYASLTASERLALIEHRERARRQDLATGWTTRRRNGHTEWLPPPHLDTGQALVNHYFHPHHDLREPEGGDGGPD
ncbi:hypothetical protein [Mycolicibacterium sp. S2-37]|uniref:hypothetical protein n=1 Tax=Mycolicibacterium sp. S2-37 TaxID=2810297 RepID=UPI001F5FAF32